jgi:hypothetical protein
MMGKPWMGKMKHKDFMTGGFSYACSTPARSRRTERRRLLALQRKAAKLNRSIDRLVKSTG